MPRLPDTPCYANQRLETMKREDLKAIQFKMALYRLEWAFAKSPFYRKKFKAAGITSIKDDIKSWDDFYKKVPFVDKAELVEDEVNHPPFGTKLTVPPEQIVHLSSTGGTSGQGAESFPMTKFEWNRWAASAGGYWTGFYWSGLRKGGVSPAVFGMGISGGTRNMHESAVKAGALGLVVGTYPTEEKLKYMKKYSMTWLYTLPSYLNVLATTAERLGMKPAEDFPRLQGIAVPGETFPINWAMRMEEVWNCKVNEFYGNTQTGAIIAFCCEKGAVPNGKRGKMHLNEFDTLVEIINPDTNEHVRAGEDGEMVLTSFNKVAVPYIRYRTRDKARYLPYTECDCGRTWDIIEAGSVGRLDDMIKIKGMNVWPQAVEEVMFAHEVVDDFQAQIFTDEKSGQTDIIINIALKGKGLNYGKDEKNKLFAQITEDVRRKVGVGMKVKEVLRSELPDASEGYQKVRRFIDARKMS